MTNDTQTTNTETTDTYIPSPSDWVREQVETIEATGDTRSVDIMGLPVVLLTGGVATLCGGGGQPKSRRAQTSLG